MKCPLFHAAEMAHEPELNPTNDDCLKEECAWWDRTFECCDPTGLAHTLERLTDTLADIQSKMPFAGQFTK